MTGAGPSEGSVPTPSSLASWVFSRLFLVLLCPTHSQPAAPVLSCLVSSRPVLMSRYISVCVCEYSREKPESLHKCQKLVVTILCVYSSLLLSLHPSKHLSTNTMLPAV